MNILCGSICHISGTVYEKLETVKFKKKVTLLEILDKAKFGQTFQSKSQVIYIHCKELRSKALADLDTYQDENIQLQLERILKKISSINPCTPRSQTNIAKGTTNAVPTVKSLYISCPAPAALLKQILAKYMKEGNLFQFQLNEIAGLPYFFYFNVSFTTWKKTYCSAT